MTIFRNAALGLVGAVVPITISLITVPFYSQAVGVERYGVLSIVWVFLGYFGLMDFGLGGAIAQKLAASRNETQRHKQSIFWTSCMLGIVFGAVGSIILYRTLGYAIPYLKFSSEMLARELAT